MVIVSFVLLSWFCVFLSVLCVVFCSCAVFVVFSLCCVSSIDCIYCIDCSVQVLCSAFSVVGEFLVGFVCL